MLPRIPSLFIAVQTWYGWFLCVVTSLPANGSSALDFPLATSVALYPPSTNTSWSPVDRAAPNSYPTETGHSLENSTSSTDIDDENSSKVTDKNSTFHWGAEQIALRVGVIVAILVAIVGMIKLTLIVHSRCASKDDLYSHVDSI